MPAKKNAAEKKDEMRPASMSGGSACLFLYRKSHETVCIARKRKNISRYVTVELAILILLR